MTRSWKERREGVGGSGREGGREGGSGREGGREVEMRARAKE